MALGKTDKLEDPNIPHLRILVVDDDELNRRMMKILLTREGHDVELAANGMEALDAVKYHKFDIVFMDLQMPTIDGIESSRRIREWENGGMHTFIVALTASYLPEEGQRLFEAGIDNYISKPFEIEHIQRMLNLISKNKPMEPVLVHSDPSPALQPTDTSVLDLSDFLRGLPKRLETLQQDLLERNMDAFSREAHNLKGVASNLGAMQLAECADLLDKQGNEGYTPLVEGSFLELKNAEKNLLRTANEFLVKQGRMIEQA
jgi:two-component system sensor histidine kinase/response regulator